MSHQFFCLNGTDNNKLIWKPSLKNVSLFVNRWCIEKCITGGENWQPNMVLDDGGDATHLLIKKYPSVIKVQSFKVIKLILTKLIKTSFDLKTVFILFNHAKKRYEVLNYWKQGLPNYKIYISA